MRMRTAAGVLAIVALGVMCLELVGVRTTLATDFRGDIERETRFLAQFGQFSCVAIVVAAIWLLDPPRRRAIPFLVAVVLLASGAANVAKHLTGRVRPHHENAGRFVGPSLSVRSSNASFPSGHTTAAVAFGGALAGLYPRGRALFWTLAGLCGGLRWALDAHWLSDVFAGAALGLIVVDLAHWARRRWLARHESTAAPSLLQLLSFEGDHR